MDPSRPTPPTGPAAPHRPLLVLFVGSGCAALIYEVVWLQLLQLVIGSTAASLGVLLGTFLGGMGAGSLLLPRLVSGRRHPLRVYALPEAGLGAIGLAVLFGMPDVEQVYARYAGPGLPGLLLPWPVVAYGRLTPSWLARAAPGIVEEVPTGLGYRPRPVRSTSADHADCARAGRPAVRTRGPGDSIPHPMIADQRL